MENTEKQQVVDERTLMHVLKEGVTVPVTQMFYGRAVTTYELNGAHCDLCNGATYEHACLHGGDSDWCFGAHILSVSASAGWYFASPTKWIPHCVVDNQGSYEWNMDYVHYWQVLQSSPIFIQVKAFFSSRQIVVNIGCEATLK